MAEFERKIALHRTLLEAIQQVLPVFLHDHCVDCVVRRDASLLLFTDAAAWGTQLRFYQPAMLQALRSINPAFSRIEVRIMIRPNHLSSAGRSRAPNRVTQASIANIIATAQDQQNNALKDALERLASTMNKRFYDE